MKASSFLYKILSVFVLLSMIAGMSPIYASTPPDPPLMAVPDTPESITFNPTQIKDLKAADPGANITLIDVPQVNPMGDVQLSYPLELPPGRSGMHPQLAVAYSSSGGNGWLGLGWDIPIPAITIDTRWGMPRYDANNETETYLLNGEQLTPLAHRGQWQPRSAEKLFHMRLEGEFLKIIRHGSGPNNYWWEVTDKAGTTYYYGGDVSTAGPAPDSTLTVDALNNVGNIFTWVLREVRDTHGNTIQYRHMRVQDSGLVNGTVPGHELYLQTINYTGYKHEAGPYKVTFIRDRDLGEKKRSDVMIDAQGGFKRVSADLLRRIEITFNHTSIRSYQFNYTQGAFQKTLLSSITQFGPDGSEFNAHRFTYYDELRDEKNEYHGFESSSIWNTHRDDISAPLRGNVYASAMSGDITDQVSGHLYGGFNFFSPDKLLSAGVKSGYNYRNTEGVLELIDINGDNLPDKVFKKGGTIFFRPNTADSNANPNGIVFGERQQISGLPGISEETGHTFSVGPEAYPVANILENNAWSWTTQPVYFADANGDRLVDLVYNNMVLFSYLNEAGVPVFSPFSSITPVPISPGSVDTNGILQDYEWLYQKMIDTFPLHDTIRLWKAPYDGQILITGTVSLSSTDPGCSQYEKADGVRVAIQFKNTEVWSTIIAAGDTNAKIPEVGLLDVTRGDTIYFRVQSVFNGACDQVMWDPEISYLSSLGSTQVESLSGDSLSGESPLAEGGHKVYLPFVQSSPPGADDTEDTTEEPEKPDKLSVSLSTAMDANLLNPYHYRASEDFVLAGRRDTKVSMPITGTVALSGTLQKLGPTTDDIILLVLKNNNLVFSQVMTWNQTGNITPTLNIEVNPDDTIQLRMKVDSPIDLTRIQWTPRLTYIASPDMIVTDPEGNYFIQLYPPYDIDMYPLNDLTSPQQAWIAPYTGTVTATTQIPIMLCPSFPWFPCEIDGHVTFTAKRPGELLAKDVIEITNLIVVHNATVTFDVAEGDEVFFDYSVYQPELGDILSEREPFNVRVVYDPATFVPPLSSPISPTSFLTEGVLHRSTYPGLLPLPYRGWGYVGYNGNRGRANQPINQNDFNKTYHQDYEYDAAKENVHPFNPIPEEGIWRGPDDLGWVSSEKVSASRLGRDDLYVPRPDDFGGGSAVSRQSETFQAVLGLGVSLLSGSIILDGYSRSEVDFMDLNGDQFPDIVSGDYVQFTTPSGGLQPQRSFVPGLGQGYVRETEIDGKNLGIGGNAAFSLGNAKGKVGANGGKSPGGSTTSSQMVTLGFSGSLGEGSSYTKYDLMDMNGDGLPDRVAYDTFGNLAVALNLGYQFGAPESWGIAWIDEESSSEYSLQPNLGFNRGIYDFGGGLSFTSVDSEVSRVLLDINGDGLPDQLIGNGSSISIAFNTGNGFAPLTRWYGTSVDPLISSQTIGLGGGGYFTFGIGPLCLVGCYIIMNPGGDGSQSLARKETDLRDVDGDGYPDFIESEDESSMKVARNLTGRTNLLKSVVRPLGAKFQLEYELDGNTYEMPLARWTLAKVTLFDGYSGDGVDEQVTTFSYENGHYDRMEREFYGYRTVLESHHDHSQGDRLYRTITHIFHNDSYYTRGLLEQEITQDADGKKYLASNYNYILRDVLNPGEPVNPHHLTAPVFPELRSIETCFYEGQDIPGLQTSQIFEYDAWGNLSRMLDRADEARLDDDVETVIEYFEDIENYIVGNANSLHVTANGTEMRRREATLQPGTGEPTQVRMYLADGSAAVTDIDYDPYGNVVRMTGPENAQGQRYSLAYTYDDQVHTYVTRVEDSFGYVSTAQYNLKYGQMEHSTDINGNATDYAYDQFGRVSTIVGPYQTGTGLYTIRFEYHHEAEVPWALTQHLDIYRDIDDPIETVVFIDGLKRIIQAKKDATIHTSTAGNAQDRMIVSGATNFDFIGRPIEQYYPITEELGSQGVFNPAVDSVKPTRMTYDVLDRNVSTTIPDDTFTRYEYGFGPDRQGRTQFRMRVTDANGNPKEIYRDVRNLITAVKEFNDDGNQVIWTSYEYDPLKQMLRVVDDQNNVTESNYDNLGRRTHLYSPDSGLTEIIYDLASNPIRRVTGNLRAGNKAIVYDYRYNRLTGITYPDFPENNVTYTYGAPGAAHNRANRIVMINDESGLEEFFYGPLGDIVKTIKTVASDTQGNSPNSLEVYTTEYVYDTWNRLQALTYPDGEVLTYEYDSGGLVRAAAGSKGGYLYSYLDRMEYDKFEAPAFLEVANKTRTVYGYNPLDHCLEVIQTGQSTGSGNLFQDLRLTCDNVGNITALANLAAVKSPSQMGGETHYTFQYDNLNRLTHADGTFDYQPNKQHRYQLDIIYDTIHNITAKAQQHQIREPSGALISQHKTTYNWQYAYGGSPPHAPAHLGEWTFGYDANGNQTGWDHDQNGTRRSIIWDEENRIQSISNNGHTMTYKYNAAGERVIKRGPQGETVYVNPFFTIRNREVGTKHVYAGRTRLVSKLMKQDKPGANPQGKVPLEKDLYFYHPNHLGTSMYVTDAAGELYEHLEYFPFGETFVEESSNTQRTPYLFTAKEFDEETQLYYFGARYYDPATSIWLSPDPILNDYLPMVGSDTGLLNGGVYNSRNLQLYGYAEQNPATCVDFDGLAPRKQPWYSRWYNRIRNYFAGGPARQAGRWQGRGLYPGVDVWENVTLPKGTLLVAGLKGQGGFYADFQDVQGKGLWPEEGNPSAQRYYGGVQVTKGSYPSHRPWIAVFKLSKAVPAARSQALANPQYGAGGVVQYYIKDWKGAVSKPPFFMKQAYDR